MKRKTEHKQLLNNTINTFPLTLILKSHRFRLRLKVLQSKNALGNFPMINLTSQRQLYFSLHLILGSFTIQTCWKNEQHLAVSCWCCICRQDSQSCLSLCDPVNCSPPGSSVSEILQAKILEWVAISSSRGSSPPGDWTHVSCISCTARWILYHWAPLGSPRLRRFIFSLA